MSEILFQCRTKATWREGDRIRPSIHWLFARRANLVLTDEAMICGDWQIPYHEIRDAALVKVMPPLALSYRLVIWWNDRVYQFLLPSASWWGVTLPSFWKGALPFPMRRLVRFPDPPTLDERRRRWFGVITASIGIVTVFWRVGQLQLGLTMASTTLIAAVCIRAPLHRAIRRNAQRAWVSYPQLAQKEKMEAADFHDGSPDVPLIVELIDGYAAGTDPVPIQPEPPPGIRQLAGELRLLPVHIDRGGCLGLRTNGDVAGFGWEDVPPKLRIETDPRWRSLAYYKAWRRYPALASFAPTRPPHAIECPHCEGTGQPIGFATDPEDRWSCYCSGVGWLLRGDRRPRGL
jgi:hypothetical protein